MTLASNLKSLIVNRVVAVDDAGPTPFYITQSSTSQADAERVDGSFLSHVQQVYKSNGIVAACMAARLYPFSEARFQFQEIVDGRPGRLFNGPGLSLLDAPFGVNTTTGQLLKVMLQDADLAGNAYLTTVGQGTRLRRMRPDWVTIISGVRNDPSAGPFDLEAEVLAYVYDPKDGHTAPVLLSPERVVHFSPLPDPEAQWRGMSWLTPVLREIAADQYMTEHKEKFFKQGATLGTVISYDKSINPTQFAQYVALFEENHRGAKNAYKTLHMGGGATAQVIGADLKQLDFRAVQGALETRIASAAGVGAIIARFSEGLAGSALNQGNYAAAKRQYADMTLRPLWRDVSASLEKLTHPPVEARLWYDIRDVAFLKEDSKDAAEILQITATTINALVTAGYTPDSVTVAVESGDLSRLVHSGMYSVQLQNPGDINDPVQIAGLLQKIYLAVTAGVITVEEARGIANRAGALLPLALPSAP